MKYSEAKQQIESLSKKYSAHIGSIGDFSVYYKGVLVGWVNQREYSFNVDTHEVNFKQLPFSNKMYMILAELSTTPVKSRKDKIKYKVSVLNEYLNIDEHNKPLLADDFNTDSYQTIFTLAEIFKIKERKDIPFDWNEVYIKPIYMS